MEDVKTVERLEILQNMSGGWDENLTDAEIHLIDTGLDAIERGEVLEHHNVMEEAVAYLKNGE